MSRVKAPRKKEHKMFRMGRYNPNRRIMLDSQRISIENDHSVHRQNVQTMTIEKYIELNEKFPLEESLDSETSHRAIEVFAELSGHDDEFNIHEFAYMAALEKLIEEYAATNDEFGLATPGHEVLEFLLEEHQMSLGELSDKTGIAEDYLARYLAGQSELRGSQIKKLGECFSINPSAFLLY